MRVKVHIHEEEVEGDYGFVDGLKLTCSRCDHYVTVFGTGQSSARRGAAKLRENCDEDNFYDVSDWID